MKLRFIGEDGSMGLRYGRIYICRIGTSMELLSMNECIWVEFDTGTSRGVRRCPYSSIKKLLENWEEV